MRPLFFFALLFTLLTSSCGKTLILDEFQEIKGGHWTYDNVLSFEIDIKDTTSLYDLYLEVEHDEHYANQNAYVQIHTTFPKGEKVSQVLSLEMAAPSGKWHGSCSSEKCVVPINLLRNAPFNQLGKHQWQIEQYMRTETIEGIHKVTFKIEDTGKDKQ